MKIDRKTVDQNIDIKHGKIEMTHGSGGRAMASLIDEMFTQPFSNPLLEQKNDQAVFPVEAGRMVMSTDSFVISPLFFPGGNIGSLAIHGTVLQCRVLYQNTFQLDLYLKRDSHL